MTEYIDRDALLKHKRYLSLDRYEIECVVDVDRIIEAQAADVAPVERGKWIIHGDNLFPLGSTQECSVCHEHENITLVNNNYCPNCGARMEDEV